LTSLLEHTGRRPFRSYRGDRVREFLHGELLAEACEYFLDGAVLRPQGVQVAPKFDLEQRRWLNSLENPADRCCGLNLDLTGWANQSPAEDDRRNMALANGAQAHQKSDASRRDSFLVYGWNDRGVE